MRNRINAGLGLLVSLLLIGPVTDSLAATLPHQSVVRVKSKHSGGSGIGSGFAWSGSHFVVTALHVVAGASRITIYSEGAKKSASAKVHSVLLEADLALLKLERDIGLVPFETESANPNSTESYFIWGFPRDVSEMTRHKIEMVGGLNQSPTLASIFKNRKQLQKTIGPQGYPAFDARIFRITKIQPGHSGAPILNKAGKVIGIGDGGLRDGLVGLNWAIPATIYLPNLPDSPDTIPGHSSVQSALFNVPVDEEPVVFSETHDHSLQRIWQTSVSEIAAWMQDEQLDEVYKDLDSLAREDVGHGLAEALVDVYEDGQTGATFVVPQGINFHYDPQDKLLIASAGKGSKMMIQATLNDNWEVSRAKMETFNALLEAMEIAWQEVPDWPDVHEVNEQEKYAYSSFYRWVLNPEDEDALPLTELDSVLLADGKGFLGTAVIARDLANFSREDWYNYYLMMMCVNFVDFANEYYEYDGYRYE